MRSCGYSTVVVLQLPKLATRVRFPLPAVVPIALLLLISSTGCASHHAPVTSALQTTPMSLASPQARGSYYQVQPGESLWGIAHDFGWDVNKLARVNRLTDPSQVKTGQKLYIPPPPPSARFLWPVRGRVVPLKGLGTEAVRGLQIAAQQGMLVRAVRTGRVAVAARDLVGWGKTVILDHGDGYTSVYAGLDQLLVDPGMSVAQGNPVGSIGAEPLHFEIRQGTSPANPMQLLP